MKKLFLLYPFVVIIALVAMFYTSCKKPHHSLAPTPNNIRLMSYTAITKVNSVAPLAVADTFSDNYTFVYDAYNRVSKITYTSSNPSLVGAGVYMGSPIDLNRELISFYYGNDTVIKTIAYVTGAPVFEIDTLLVPQSTGLISTIFSPHLINTFQYYGKLMAYENDEYYNNYHGLGATTVSDTRTFNSDNGNFLNYSFNGTLTATFPTTMTFSPYAMRDYWIQTPNFPYLQDIIDVNAVPQLNGTVHNPLTSYTDQLNYTTSGIPLIIFAKDTANDTCFVDFPGTIWPNQTYTFYDNLYNRPGDYLQLNSFTLWGNNLYQNASLVKSISNSGYITNVTYNIDAFNKITQLTAITVDSLANTKTVTYNLQYELF